MAEIHFAPMSSGFIPVILNLEQPPAGQAPYRRRAITTLEIRMDNTINLMIVDDNSRARQALTAYLSLQSGIRIITQASNGLEAVNMIRNQIPDIVLMDIQMPVMDGLEATKIIKNRWPGIKVIALTMYPNYQREALSGGADEFLVKGCSMDEMLSAIHKQIRRGPVTPVCE